MADTPEFQQYSERLRFTGSGSEYFRIWIVNLLLTILTLGLYSPWAKVRRLRYFYGNTYLAEAPFEFHGRPVPILVGRVISLSLLFVYANPQIFSWQLSLATAILIAVLLPILLQRSLRFRLRNTSWRNLRFGFRGTPLQAYKALLMPVAVALGLGGGILALAVWTLGEGLVGSATTIGEIGVGSGMKVALGVGLLLLLAIVATPLVIAAFYTAFRGYGGNHAAFGTARFSIDLRLLDVAKIQLIGTLITVLLFSALIGLILLSVMPAVRSEPQGSGDRAFLSQLPLLFVPFFYLGLWAIAGFVSARLQRLVWSHTRLESHRFDCDLSAWRYAWLMVKNLLLTILTAGLYRPFAAVAKARAQLESVRFHPAGSVDSIVAKVESDAAAIGEEFIDALDFDMSF